MEEKNSGSRKLEEAIRKYTLLNAYTHGGKAQSQAVLRKVLGEMPEYRDRAQEVLGKVGEQLEEINRLSVEEQRKLIEEAWPNLLAEREPKPEREVLPPLPNVERYRKVVTRFSPNPDCVLHVGSARAIVLCWKYAEMYGGEFYLRFEDTDPKVKKPVLEFYESIREDLLWLGCKWNKEFIQSERLEIYYEYAEKLLQSRNTYVCTCPPEKFRELTLAQKPCPCRDLPAEEHMERWTKMLNGELGEGQAVVRVKTDLQHPNPAIRDWPALRVVDTRVSPHPRVGDRYRVWPLYNFSCGLDDHLMGITHIIRGKEHLTNEQRQRYMYKHLGWDYPEAIHYGRLKITGAVLSKSKIKSGLEKGLYSGYSDPRLATFAALRRRGITSEAVVEMMLNVGMKPVDVTLSRENLYAANRKLIDPVANRYFFIDNPLLLVVRGVKKSFTVKLPLHPDHAEKGYRVFEVSPRAGKVRLLASSNDRKLLQPGTIIRLKGLFNIEVEALGRGRVSANFQGDSYEVARRLQAPVIHYIPSGSGIPSKVVMPDASAVEGVAEDACRNLKEGDVIQFERFGFVRVDKVDSTLTAYFSHR